MTMAMISASVAMPRVEPDFGDRPTRDGDGVIDRPVVGDGDGVGEQLPAV